jgi:alpha-mannosidase
MILYRQWIREEFDINPPKIAWQLDIFGHSAAHAQLITEMGIEAMVFARMPYDLQQSWMLNKHMEFIWKP